MLFNRALKAFNITWTKISAAQQQQQEMPRLPHDLTLSWEGHTPSGLKVKLLPQEVACRESFCRRELRGKPYIWHHGKTKHQVGLMSDIAEQDGVWFLREDWRSTVNGERVMGLDWLKRIAQLRP